MKPAINHVPEGSRLYVPAKDFGSVGRIMPEGAIVVDGFGRVAFLTPEMVREHWELLVWLRKVGAK